MAQNGRSPGRSPGRTTGNTTSARPDRPAAARPAPGLRGYQRLRLLKDLATSPQTPREIAQNYGLRLPVLLAFREAHEQEIAELNHAFSRGLPTETSGLWITRKENRLAELENEAEQIRDTLQEYRDDGIPWSRSHRDMIRTYLEILRTVADETGAYPQRQAAPQRSGSTVHYVIDTGSQDATEALQ